MKFFNLKSMIGMFLILFMAACQDDTGSGAKVEEGLAAKLNLSIQVPAVEEVNTRAIADNESQINELALFMYSVNSDLRYRVDLTGKLTEGPATADGYRSYTVKEEIPVQTGTFTIYAVANWSSRFANCDLNDDISEEQLKAMMGNGDDVYQLQSGDYLPMTDIVKDVTFYTGEEATKNELHLSLKRTTARIEFTIQDGEKLEAVNGHFTPTSYKIFSLPKASYLFDAGQATIENLNTYNVGSIDLTAGAEATTFEFLMNENVQPAGQNITEYKDREMFTGAWQKHNFINAPKTATYVEIEGTYEDNTQIATVSYVVHLGNFTSSADASIDNFTVNRNERHKYSVTVNGIDNVTTTSTVELLSPGSFSDDKATKVLEFVSTPEAQDAHYVIYPIEINTQDLRGDWVVEVADAESHPWITLKKDLSDLQKLGYWTYNELGDRSVTGSEMGRQTIYAFLEENAANDAVPRTATLNLYKKDFPSEVKTFEVNQLPVAWNNGIGVERIEDGAYPWGFKWTRNVTLQYSGGNVFIPNIWVILVQIFYPELGANMHLGIPPSAKIDYTQYNSLDNNTASSTNDGLSNTWDLYNYTGGSADAFEATLKGWGYVVTEESGENENVSEYAALMCLKKNRFYAETSERGDQTITAPVIEERDIKWYLPASGQFPMEDSEYPLTGDYWTSTAVAGSEHAYKYTVGSGASQDDRASVLKVRAARVRN